MTDNLSASLQRQAAEWAVRLEGAVTEQERREFEAWVSHPAHEREFLAQVSIEAVLRELPLKPRTQLLQVVTRASVAVSSSKPSFRVRYAALAATVLIGMLGAVWFFGNWSATRYSYVTGTGDLRKVTLTDGSSAMLNTRSELRWIGNERDRRVLLKRGQALFDVVPDAKHPFSVFVDGTEIQVLGTVFDVYRKEPDGTLLVTVLEGTVHVTHRDSKGISAWSRTLVANQQIVHRPGASPAVRTVDATRAVQWRNGKLDVKDELLPEVIAELSRYTDRHLTLANDARLRDLYVGGVYSTHDLDRALARLKAGVPVEVIWNARRSEYTLTYRDDPPESAGRGEGPDAPSPVRDPH